MQMASSVPPDFAGLVAALSHWAATRPEAVAVTVLKGEAAESMTHAELYRRALGVGHALAAVCRPGDRVLLGFEQGAGYLAGFLGCVFAGAVAVTSAPPDELRRSSRLAALLADSGARVILADGESAAKFDGVVNQGTVGQGTVGQEGPLLLNTDTLSGDCLDAPYPAAPDDLMLLQYTSGSTSAPKGVMLTHASMAANLRAIMADTRPHGATVYVSWLPLYHDMGLIFMALSALYAGRPLYLMAPAEFLRYPERWLRALSTYGGTITAAPNFAYRLCTERVSDAQLKALDLSRMERFVNGAEPVRVEDMAAFLDRFAPAGLRREAIHGGYGMAELGVYASSGPMLDGSPAFDRTALESLGCAVPVAADDPEARLVAPCGRVNPGHFDVRIVNPDSGSDCPTGEVGEIWLAGASVGKGYWGKAEETAATFGNRLAGSDVPYLRTGDTGFLYGGHLYICGRLKEVMIVRGRNVFPGDVCAVLESGIPEMRGRRAAAFSIPGPDGEAVVVACAARVSPATWRDVAARITGLLGMDLGIVPADVVFLPNRALGRTTSGKVQHMAMRRAYLDGTLEYDFAIAGPPPPAFSSSAAAAVPAVAVAAQAPAMPPPLAPPDWLVRRVCALCADVCGGAVPDEDANLFELGLDSLRAVRLIEALEAVLPGSITHMTLADLIDLRTPRGVAQAIVQALEAPPAARSEYREIAL